MFTLSKEQRQQLDAWCDTLNPNMSTYAGSIGGRLTYCFTPTSLGIVVKIKDSMSETEIDLTDYDSW